jgi:membrane-bound serine protease (ClpP class)
MESVFIAIFFAYLLILIEGFLPGGIFGFAGGVCLLIATYYAHLEFGGLKIPFLVFVLASLGGLLIVILEFKWLAKSKFGKSIFLSSSSNGVSNKVMPGLEIVGAEGKTLTDHKPEGIVLLNKKKYDAYSEDGHLHADKKVIVVGVDDFRIKVKEITK